MHLCISPVQTASCLDFNYNSTYINKNNKYHTNENDKGILWNFIIKENYIKYVFHRRCKAMVNVARYASSPIRCRKRCAPYHAGKKSYNIIFIRKLYIFRTFSLLFFILNYRNLKLATVVFGACEAH